MKKIIYILTIILVVCTLWHTVCFAYVSFEDAIRHFNTVSDDYVPEKTDDLSGIVYNDISQVEWAHDAIYFLTGHGILSGDGNGLFRPNDYVTIEEFTKMLITSVGLGDDKSYCPDELCPKDRWSRPYISSAYSIGLFDVFDGKFDISSPVSRQEMVYMAGKCLEILNINLDCTVYEKFTDSNKINEICLNYVYALKNADVVHGMGNNLFMPQSDTRRCEVAVIIYGIKKLTV